MKIVIKRVKEMVWPLCGRAYYEVFRRGSVTKLIKAHGEISRRYIGWENKQAFSWKMKEQSGYIIIYAMRARLFKVFTEK